MRREIGIGVQRVGDVFFLVFADRCVHGSLDSVDATRRISVFAIARWATVSRKILPSFGVFNKQGYAGGGKDESAMAASRPSVAHHARKPPSPRFCHSA